MFKRIFPLIKWWKITSFRKKFILIVLFSSMARVNFLEGKLGNDAINLYEDMIKTKRLNHLSNMYVISEGMVAGGNVLSNIVLNKALVEYGHRLARPSDIEKSVSRGFTVHPYSFDVGFQVFDMEEGMAPYMRSLVDSVKDMGGKSPSIVPSSDLEFFVQDNKFQLNICDESFKEETRLFNYTRI